MCEREGKDRERGRQRERGTQRVGGEIIILTSLPTTWKKKKKKKSTISAKLPEKMPVTRDVKTLNFKDVIQCCPGRFNGMKAGKECD